MRVHGRVRCVYSVREREVLTACAGGLSMLYHDVHMHGPPLAFIVYHAPTSLIMVCPSWCIYGVCVVRSGKWGCTATGLLLYVLVAGYG